MIDKRNLANQVIGFLTVLYPVAVYFGVQHFGSDTLEPWKIAVFLLLLVLLQSILTKTKESWSYLLLVIGVIYCCFAIWSNNLITLRFYPVLINLSFFVVFAGSLFSPSPIVERIARIQHPDLPEQGVRYTRKVTKIWCVFFIINGIIATATALWSSFAWWSLYNGFISYLLMGLLMAVEYMVRIRTQPHVR